MYFFSSPCILHNFSWKRANWFFCSCFLLLHQWWWCQYAKGSVPTLRKRAKKSERIISRRLAATPSVLSYFKNRHTVDCLLFQWYIFGWFSNNVVEFEILKVERKLLKDNTLLKISFWKRDWLVSVLEQK